MAKGGLFERAGAAETDNFALCGFAYYLCGFLVQRTLCISASYRIVQLTYWSQVNRILHQFDRRYEVFVAIVTERPWNKPPRTFVVVIAVVSCRVHSTYFINIISELIVVLILLYHVIFTCYNSLFE